MIKTSVLSPKLSSYWLILFTPVDFSMAKALVAGLTSETIKLNDNAERLFPHITPVGYKDSIEQAIEDIHNRQVVSSWCDSSGGQVCDLPPFVHDIAHAVFKDRYVRDIGDNSPADIYRNVSSIGGGEQGWMGGYNFLWQVRGGFIDKLIGGYGINRGRRDQLALRIGDSLDFWKVADLVPDKRLLLSAQMKLPGKAWLEFQIIDGYLIVTAFFY